MHFVISTFQNGILEASLTNLMAEEFTEEVRGSGSEEVVVASQKVELSPSLLKTLAALISLDAICDPDTTVSDLLSALFMLSVKAGQQWGQEGMDCWSHKPGSCSECDNGGTISPD